MKTKPYYSLWLLPLLLIFQSGESAMQQASNNNYALFFAVSDYESGNGLADLQNPVRNAREIAKELREKYNFQTEIVENPTLKEIRSKFKEYENKFKRGGGFDPQGQLLIFFSGHGVERYRQGYFMAADSDPDDPAYTAIQYDQWRNRIDALNCQHILVAVDACHSAHFDPKFKTRSEKDFKRSGELSESEKILEDHKKYKARFFFTSDGEGQETPDRSNFAKKFLEAFRSHQSQDGFMTSSVLFASYLKRADPRPRGGTFGQDEASASFLFFEKAKPKIDTRNYAQRQADIRDYTRAKDADNIAAFEDYLNKYPQGSFRREAQTRQLELADETDWEYAQLKGIPEAYAEYLRLHPNGQYVTQARRLTKQSTTSTIRTPSGTPDLPDMVFIQGGTFQMGDQFREGVKGEKPVHQVTVSDYYISNHEVTNWEFVAFLNEQGNQKAGRRKWYEIGSSNAKIKERNGRFEVDSGYENHPVVGVSWYGAIAFCNWKSEQAGLQKVYTIRVMTVSPNWLANGYRLPTEAEWEYAARSRGKKEKWAGTSTESEVSKYCNNAGEGDSYDYTAPVKSFLPNDLGLYDMSGNVGEWCWDWYSTYYYADSKNTRDPKGAGAGSYRVRRGGSWFKSPMDCRAAIRLRLDPVASSKDLGFRFAQGSK